MRAEVVYDQDFLITFNNNINILDVSLAGLMNSLEKNVSQKEYHASLYQHFVDKDEFIKIRFLNTHIPHLIGLSRNHHFGLQTYHSELVFENLKMDDDWTLEKLKAGDEKWFDECKDKIIGCFYLYQMLNDLETKTFHTEPFKGPKNHRLLKRIKRDEISYIMIKTVEGIQYSLEFAPFPTEAQTFFPRSLKINDSIEDFLHPVTFTDIKVLRLKKQKRKKRR